MRALMVSARHAAFSTANGVRIQPEATLDECTGVPLVCVPELTVTPGETISGRFRAEIAWLRERYAAGATLATACSGAMLLAEAGLLDGQEATTHWAYCDALRQRYPAIKVLAQRALVVSGEAQRLVMAGGGTSWLDLEAGSESIEAIATRSSMKTQASSAGCSGAM